MDKLGLRSDIDLALHLPLRYEDETRLTPLAALREGMTAQVEAVVSDSRIETRPRRQLIVRLRDGGEELLLRFLHFYPSQQKSLAFGVRVRVRGEVRGGFFGREMVHPALRLVDDGSPLPSALTPVYPSSAQLPQAYLRKAIASALARAPLQELLPPALLPPGLPSLREALHFLHHPPPDAEPVYVGRPQPPGLAAPEVRGAAGAAAVASRRPNASACTCARPRCWAAAMPGCSSNCGPRCPSV